MKPFLVPDARMLRTDGPDRLRSRAYARDFNEVKSLGSLTSTTRTADQTMAAVFWQAQPGGLYGGVMRSLSARYGLSTAQNARLFAMVSLAAADGAIGCWNDKARWSFWRPIDAIRLAATDGNRRTRADATWTPLFDAATAAGLTDAGLPGPPVGARLRERRVAGRDAGLLRHATGSHLTSRARDSRGSRGTSTASRTRSTR